MHKRIIELIYAENAAHTAQDYIIYDLLGTTSLVPQNNSGYGSADIRTTRN